MDVPGPRKYTVLPKQCIDLWVESSGVPKLGDDVSEILAEDVAYRVREAVHNAMRVMKHCKRSCLTTDDFNHGLSEGNTELIYGHGGIQSLGFKSISCKEDRVCYIEEKELNLRDLAVESSYPADSGDVSVKANWLVLEGHLCSALKGKDDYKNSLKDPISPYLNNVTAALIGKSDYLRKIALKDLMVNKKLQVVLPHLVSFLSLQIKHHTGKDSFVLIASYILLAINSLVENQSILLTPYVFQLVKIMLFVVIEAQIPASKWLLKNKAAHVLSHLCKKQNLLSQLLKSYQDNLEDSSRPLNFIYGAIVGVKILGVEAVENVLYPVLREKLKLFSEKCKVAESDNEIIELACLKDAFISASSLLLKHSKTINVLIKNTASGGLSYSEIYEVLGEELLADWHRSKHEPPININSKLAAYSKGHVLNSGKPAGSVAMKLIEKYTDKLKAKNITSQPVENEYSTKIVIDDKVTHIISKKRKLKEPHLVFKDCKDFDSENDIPYKRANNVLVENSVRREHRGCHPSYKHKYNRVKDLSVISNYLPIL